MNCKDVNKIIADFFSGDISQQGKNQVLEHLAGCSKCRKELSALANIEKKLGQLFDAATADYSIPDNTLERIKTRIASGEQNEEEEQNQRRLAPRWEWIPQRLGWKKAIVGLFIVCLVIILSVIMPMFVSDNSEALAIDIALNNSQIKATLGDRQLDNMETSEISDDGHTFVILDIDSELLIIAEVDTGKKEVVKISSLELNDKNKQEIIAIAGTDTRIESLLDQGAEITSFKPAYNINLETKFVQLDVEIRITLNDKLYVALIDLENEEVKSLIPLPY
jgi:hypothetical protein